MEKLISNHHLFLKTNKTTACLLFCFAFLYFFIFTPLCFAVEHELLYPENLTYLGAFRLPNETSGGSRWEGGGRGMTYYPNGDPSGPSDGFPGSLFSLGHTGDSLVSEITIPVPVISSNHVLNELNTASTLQGFTDVSGGVQVPSLTDLTVCDIQYLPKQGSQSTDKLYWVMFHYYMPTQEMLTLGWCELDFSSLNSRGVWHFGEYSSAATSRYLFDIPHSYADRFFGGRYLAAGRFRALNGGSLGGPSIYASAPWNNGNPPESGANINTIRLLHYTEQVHMSKFSRDDDWNDGAFLTSGNKSAVIISGEKGYRTDASGMETYGFPQPDDTGYKGYHANPNFGVMLFYDPYLLGLVSQGKLDPGEIQPYAVFNAHDFLYNSDPNLPSSVEKGRGSILGGMGYDRVNKLLYVMEMDVDGAYDPGKPIVHVFQVNDDTIVPDVTPPSVPGNLHVISNTSDTVTIGWNNSTDNSHVASYVIYRNGQPVDPRVKSTYIDSRVNPNGRYEYRVLAFDSNDNRSELSAPLIVTTPSGTSDTRIPLIADVHIINITENGATINWKTGEPSTSKIEIKIEYSGDDFIVFNDNTLTREHQVILSNLPELSSVQRYEYYIISIDQNGNENRYQEQNFRTLQPGMSSMNNATPVLDGIGAKRINSGETIQFTIYADDKDRYDTLTYSASGLPAGASFNPSTRIFRWATEHPDDIGSYNVTFRVSDGDQSDSETVKLFVLANPEGPPMAPNNPK